MSKLIFVYNADAGYFNMVADIAHKIFSPATYPCSLCDLTYGVFKIRPEWDEFVKNSPLPFEFLHKDEFQQAYPDWKNTPLPVILRANTEPTEILISDKELNSMSSVAALRELVLSRISVASLADAV